MRNKFFDWHLLKEVEFNIPVIAVGNLAVGGTGKTPHVEYIVELMRRTRKVAVLSRGYKRETRGFVMAGRNSMPRDIGDESYQIYRKFGGEVVVAVCEDRVYGIRELLRVEPSIEMIVLDDAFQHRYVKPTVSIVITEYSRPIYEDAMLPYGRLREPARGINRADMVIVANVRFRSSLPTTAWKSSAIMSCLGSTLCSRISTIRRSHLYSTIWLHLCLISTGSTKATRFLLLPA